MLLKGAYCVGDHFLALQCYMKFDFARNFTKWEKLVRNIRHTGTNFSRAVSNWYSEIYEM